MRRFKFYKDPDNRWYVDLPEWMGKKADLEMVAGADSMLEYMAEGENQVWLTISEENFDNSDRIDFVRMATEYTEGAFYKMLSYKGIQIDLDMWLCDVTEWVFGKFPETLYVAVTN